MFIAFSVQQITMTIRLLATGCFVCAQVKVEHPVFDMATQTGIEKQGKVSYYILYTYTINKPHVINIIDKIICETILVQFLTFLQGGWRSWTFQKGYL